MIRFVIPLVLALTADAAKVHQRSLPSVSAASDAQIKFAIENKYDDTGPGAKKRESAYNTYKTLEEALLSYIDDPDTKLPDREKAIGLEQLYSKNQDYYPKGQYQQEYLPQYEENRKPSQPLYVNRYSFPNKKVFYHDPSTKVGVLDLRGYNEAGLYNNLQGEDSVNSYKNVKGHREVVSSTPHYDSDSDLQDAHDQFDSHPQYTFSYGVHDKHTGDSKAAHETRDGGSVRGYYSFVDADGKQRTVHYVADDKQGFRATVQRTDRNTQ